ncbi:3beta-hydroxysteroid dehydrogenase [Obelidium mucronatum]|nr:3beta-hydroxysteroid dehydrogenase [Obelidium mucronatum]
MVGLNKKANQVESWIVIGGCGFLGRRIVELLLERGEVNVAVFDMRRTFDNDRVQFFVGDITKLHDVEQALQGRTVVIHTASPPHGLGADVYRAVNVVGTQNVITACKNLNISKFVYTSSASVIFNGQTLEEADETIPYCAKHLDEYNLTKATAEELVLAANCSSLRTAALRPSGIIGPRDMQGIKTMIEVAKSSKSKYQMGPNETIFDYTYVDNAADAHILAADKLNDANSGVAGEAFFITNDSPVFFWDFPKMVFDEVGTKNTLTTVFPLWLAFALAYIVEFFVLLLSPVRKIHPTLTLFRLNTITQNKYHNIEKAKKLLGYKPKVPLGEGIKRSVRWFKEEEARVAALKNDNNKKTK